MKRLTILLLIVLSVSGAALAQQPGATSATPPHHPSLGTPLPGGTQLPQISQAEWQELRAARAAALQSNHELAADSQKLVERMQALEAKVEATMVKNDPSLAPILAKLAAAHHPPGALPGAPPATVPTTNPPR